MNSTNPPAAELDDWLRREKQLNVEEGDTILATWQAIQSRADDASGFGAA